MRVAMRGLSQLDDIIETAKQLDSSPPAAVIADADSTAAGSTVSLRGLAGTAAGGCAPGARSWRPWARRLEQLSTANADRAVAKCGWT